ncbi:unnamed protein product [Caenorhabditis angaria]|uniref:Innexin n=1 Tax=Caenorhabditis angaria TaxID=860376 RepID=A0A9P1J4W0_9PELO|nr:unnamed protein product [Caenorhabditis angaria]
MFQLPFLDQFRNVVTYSQIDDFADVLSCFATPSIYLFGAILISARTYVGSPIQCWIQQTYSGAWEDYAETYCFLKNTHFVPSTEHIVTGMNSSKSSVKYYQWSSMYLAVCALCFILPKLFWKYSQTTSDIPLTYFCETTNEIRKTTTDKRKDKITEMAKYLKEKLEHNEKYGSIFFNMTTSYFITKMLYIFVALGQFYLVAVFLGQSEDILWGFTLLQNLIVGDNWEVTGIFPRITYCSFSIRQQSGDFQKHTTQCVLGVNEFNEKIFLFIWYWLVALIAITIVATLRCFYLMNTNSVVDSLMIKHRNINDKIVTRKIRDFSENYLRTNGRIILSYVKMESDIVAQELALELFEDYKEKIKNAFEDIPTNVLVAGDNASEKTVIDDSEVASEQ